MFAMGYVGIHSIFSVSMIQVEEAATTSNINNHCGRGKEDFDSSHMSN